MKRPDASWTWINSNKNISHCIKILTLCFLFRDEMESQAYSFWYWTENKTWYCDEPLFLILTWKGKWKWNDIWPSMRPLLGMCALHLTHPSAHTSWTHTRSSGQPYCGEQLGVRCLAQGHLSRGIEGGESAGHSLPPTYNSCWTWDSNPWPLGCKSYSLTIRVRKCIKMFRCV